MIFSIEFDVVQNSTFSQKWSGPRSRGGGGGQHHRGPSPRFRDEIYLSTAPYRVFILEATEMKMLTEMD